MGIATALFAIAAAAIVAAWGWLGAAVQMPPSPLASGEKLYCISYAPFRGDQSPFGPDRPIDPRQIDQDLAQLKQITDCVRTYSTDDGSTDCRDAQRHGLKVLQGALAVDNDRRTAQQIATARRARQAISRRDQRGDRRQRGVAARGHVGAATSGAQHPRGQGAGQDAGHLCRRVGVLAAQPRTRHARSTSSPSISCRTGRTSRSRRGQRPQHVDAIRKRRRPLSRQGDRDRRIRLAERRAHARGRAALAGEPGARHARGARPRQARALPCQRDRGVRPALEAPARRHGRRPLGPLRRVSTAGQFSWGGAVSESSALALAGCRRRRARRPGVRRRAVVRARAKPRRRLLVGGCESWRLQSCREP